MTLRRGYLESNKGGAVAERWAFNIRSAWTGFLHGWELGRFCFLLVHCFLFLVFVFCIVKPFLQLACVGIGNTHRVMAVGNHGRVIARWRL